MVDNLAFRAYVIFVFGLAIIAIILFVIIFFVLIIIFLILYFFLIIYPIVIISRSAAVNTPTKAGARRVRLRAGV